MFTIALKQASQNKLFNEIEIGDDFKKLMKTFQMNYSKAVNYDQTMALMERIVSFPNRQLAIFIANSLQEILNYLSIDTEILMSSDIPKSNLLRGKDKILQLCRTLEANVYYNAIGGRSLYDKEEFAMYGITLNFIDTVISPYSQLYTEEFISHLSIIDVLMNNTKEEVNHLLDSYLIIH